MSKYEFQSSNGEKYEVSAEKGMIKEVYARRGDFFYDVSFNAIRNVTLASSTLGSDCDFELSFVGDFLYVVELKPVHLGSFPPK
jgi:hypothetical protein